MAGDDVVMQVAQVFERVARLLLRAGDVRATLDEIVRLAVTHLDACEFAGVSLAVGREIESPASSDDVPRILDRLQSELHEGPCFDAIREHETFQTGDLSTERVRWPNFAVRASSETGVASVLAVRLFANEDTFGALNLYSRRRHAFTDIDVALATVFATHAAVAMDSAQRQANLERKAESRDVIGQAKGILMNRMQVTDIQAFELLRRASQHLNRKLVDVAEEVVYTGEPPAE